MEGEIEHKNYNWELCRKLNLAMIESQKTIAKQQDLSKQNQILKIPERNLKGSSE